MNLSETELQETGSGKANAGSQVAVRGWTHMMCHTLTRATRALSHRQDASTQETRSPQKSRHQLIHITCRKHTRGKWAQCLWLHAVHPSCVLHDILILSSHSCSITITPSLSLSALYCSLPLSLHVSMSRRLWGWATQNHIVLTSSNKTHIHIQRTP